MKPIRDLISREVIDDLWGAGYTILPRRRHPDPFFVPPEMVPATRSYQWWHLVHDKSQFEHSGWSAVPASRHDGYFMPAGFVGDIEVSGLGLFEKPKFEVEQERQASHDKARQNVADWVEKTGIEFSGHIKFDGAVVGVGDADVATKLFPETKTIETTVAFPADLLPHAREVFEERDRLYTALIEAWNNGLPMTVEQAEVCFKYEEARMLEPNILKGPTLNALVLPIAINNIRRKLGQTPMVDKLQAKVAELKQEKTND